MRKYTFSVEEFLEAVAGSASIRQVIEKLGMVPAGGNYRTIQKLIKALQVYTSHFLGQRWNKGRKFSPVLVVIWKIG